MESKLHIIRKKRSDLENSRLDPLMRALKASSRSVTRFQYFETVALL